MKIDTKTLPKYINIVILLTLINALLSRFAVMKSPIELGPGVSALYFAISFMIVFTLWYGLWGGIAAYTGCVIGAGFLGGLPPEVNIIWSVADFWQVLIPLAAFKILNGDIRLLTRRDMLIFLVFGLFLNNLLGAVWGSSMLFASNIVTWEQWFNTFQGWFVGNLVVTIIITPLLLRYVTPYIQNTQTYVEGYWN
ncbi:hypothetical protein J2755_001363 [Methanohalophilus levihalophilus]|uniref:hypothetical protein n=1 Tax=Methanohalophilus levihalophilus TaxID=1431282 RepID=UPI001AE5CD4D|nr:hypothetical protein [Methanohalophilus levihalophilus]MBP2030429.1 hypothetical protein [Methanohalophilus levihalophilus]